MGNHMRNYMKKTGELGDIYKDNPEAYQHVNVSYAYAALAGQVPTAKILKSYDIGILKSVNLLEFQIEADGLSHARVSIYGQKGKWDEIFDEYESGRMRAFYLVVVRTVKGYHTLDLLKRFGFHNREEVINYLPELYTNEKEPKLKVKKFGSIRDILKILGESKR